jgi:hypothetical protein
VLWALQRLDEIDRAVSSKFGGLSKTWLELILIVPAHYFYRTWGVIQAILLSSVLGTFKYNEMLLNLNFQQID